LDIKTDKIFTQICGQNLDLNSAVPSTRVIQVQFELKKSPDLFLSLST